MADDLQETDIETASGESVRHLVLVALASIVTHMQVSPHEPVCLEDFEEIKIWLVRIEQKAEGHNCRGKMEAHSRCRGCLDVCNFYAQ